jgi:hypothetical protein
VPLLENVISPAGIGSVLDIDLVVAEVGFPPLFLNDRRELGKRVAAWPIDYAMIVQSIVGTHFEDHDHLQPCTVPFRAATENRVIEAIAKVLKIA